MHPTDPVLGLDAGARVHDLRQQIASALLERGAAIAWDAVAVLPATSASHPIDADYTNRVGALLLELLAFAVRDARVDARGGFVADLYRVMLERSLPVEQLFTLVYLLERTALDELAVNDAIGATTEAWPLVAQVVRRASFDVLAAYTVRAQLEPTDAAVVDRLTTLHTRPMFEAVLGKELERAGRFGMPISVILFDVDRLGDINRRHGYGVGDKILERLGITIRKYFRQHDWVARHSEDSMVVLLTRTDAQNAAELAEKVRVTVADRLAFVDHRTDQPVQVTLSAGVVNVQATAGDVVDPERVMADAERALEQAKQEGRNRIVRRDVRYPYSSS